MLKSSRDVPEMSPAFGLGLDQVGISAKTVWINLPQGRLPFDAEILVDLPDQFRGIHMSRMEAAVSDLYEQDFIDIRQYAERLCRLILGNQRGNRASISLQGHIPQVFKTTVTSLVSVDSLGVSVKTRGVKRHGDIETVSLLGLSITHMTACPCTQVYNKALFPGVSAPCLLTHSQRCITTMQVEDERGAVSFQDLYQCLASCLHVTQDLLKRPDEAEIVLRCHQGPQFVEDVVRLVACQAGERLKGLLPGSSRIRIETISLESIHLHNVKCLLDCTLGRILQGCGQAVE